MTLPSSMTKMRSASPVYLLFGAMVFMVYVLMTSGSIASAQDTSGCMRQGRSICVSQTSAILSRAEGDVRRSRGIGFTSVQSGDGLVAGDRLMIRNGAATVELGERCEVRLGSNSLVTFMQHEYGLCAIGLFLDPAPPRPGAPLALPGNQTGAPTPPASPR